MAELYFDKEAKLWRADKVDFGTGSISVRIRFAHSGNTTLGYVKADGKDIGVIAFTSYDNEDTEARCEIDPTEGVHDVTVALRGSAKLLSFEASSEPVYAGITYEPIPEKATLDLGYDTWEATDMLGRKVASVEDVGKKKDKQVGIFYWTWHEGHADLRPVDVVEVLDKYPAAEYRKDHPAWGERPFQPYWHEPFYGFYRDSDPYIIRHHAALLSAAGVDFLLFDCTNGALTWRSAYEPLFMGLREAKADGIKVPLPVPEHLQAGTLLGSVVYAGRQAHGHGLPRRSPRRGHLRGRYPYPERDPGVLHLPSRSARLRLWASDQRAVGLAGDLPPAQVRHPPRRQL